MSIAPHCPTGLNPNYFVRGTGPGVVCLHCSTGSAMQWKALAARLESRYTVAGFDLYGYGDSPRWTDRNMLTLADETCLLEPLLERIEGKVTLVGHSYGGVVALAAAKHYPQHIRSIIVYEPVLFSLLFEDVFHSVTSEEISRLKKGIEQYLSDGLNDSAAKLFIDYWSGDGSFGHLPEHHQAKIASEMPKVLMDFEAILSGYLSPSDLNKIDCPVLVMYGLESPEATRQVANLLSEKLPKVETRELIGIGHMGPITHRDQINDIIENYLDRTCQLLGC
jgi:pimeloyl-ACP methyl ester carboxylesterase